MYKLKLLFEKLFPKSKSAARIEFLKKVFDFIKRCGVEGNYLEFGVYRGGTFSEAFNIVKTKKMDSVRFFAFDSFQGLPDISGIDKESNQFSKGEYSASLELFKSNIKKAGVDSNRVRIVPGWFKDTLTSRAKKELGIKAAAVVWIDCDLYESTVPVLEFVTDLLVDGSVIVFDDWFLFKGNPDRGEQRAFREWLVKHPEIKVSEFHKYFWHGNSFIVHK